MFTYFKKSNEQKKLYFQIDTEFKKSCHDEKLSGIYAIFKDDICLYVGQSKNMSSRIATHLSGKYQECSKILIFPTYNPSDNLIPLEKFTIQHLKPIENLLVDFTELINDCDLADGSITQGIIDCNDEAFNILDNCEYILINDKFNLLIAHDILIDLYSSNNLSKFIEEQIAQSEKSKGGIK